VLPWSGSVDQATRHQQVAETRVVLVLGGLAADHDRLGRLREGEDHFSLVDRTKSIQEVRRVEARGERVTVDGRLDGLRRLSLVARTGVERDATVTERHLDRGVATGDQRDALDG